jgi:hypothetical protein
MISIYSKNMLLKCHKSKFFYLQKMCARVTILMLEKMDFKFGCWLMQLSDALPEMSFGCDGLRIVYLGRSSLMIVCKWCVILCKLEFYNMRLRRGREQCGNFEIRNTILGSGERVDQFRNLNSEILFWTMARESIIYILLILDVWRGPQFSLLLISTKKSQYSQPVP